MTNLFSSPRPPPHYSRCDLPGPAAGGVGLWVAGIPAVAILTASMFLLAIAQIGVIPVLAVAVGWLFFKGATFAAIAMLWTVVVASLDNVVRPILIRKGADLPMLQHPA